QDLLSLWEKALTIVSFDNCILQESIASSEDADFSIANELIDLSQNNIFFKDHNYVVVSEEIAPETYKLVKKIAQSYDIEVPPITLQAGIFCCNASVMLGL